MADRLTQLQEAVNQVSCINWYDININTLLFSWQIISVIVLEFCKKLMISQLLGLVSKGLNII